MTNLTAQIFSPRWGHEDTYTFELQKDLMTISLNMKKATCMYVENQDPIWEGEPIQSILRNDGIYAPEILNDLLEYLWTSWRDGELNDVEAQTELDSLIEWLNLISKTKPKTDFWQKCF